MNSIAGVVLAGGKSSRMGQDKAFLSFNDKYMIEHVIYALEKASLDVRIIANDDRFKSLEKPVFQDIIPDQGPLGGLHTALQHMTTDFIFVLSCDTPLLTPDFLTWMLDKHDGTSIAVATENGNLHPLIGIYPKSILQRVEHRLNNHELKMLDLLREQPIQTIEATDFPGYSEQLLSNINTMTELEKIKA